MTPVIRQPCVNYTRYTNITDTRSRSNRCFNIIFADKKAKTKKPNKFERSVESTLRSAIFYNNHFVIDTFLHIT